MSDQFTRVEIASYPNHLRFWLRFGEPDEQCKLDRRRSVAVFRPGRLFGYVRRSVGEDGSEDWRFAVVKTAAPSRFLGRIDGVQPGGDVYLQVAGKRRVKRALLQIDALEAHGFRPIEVSPAYYRDIHNRISSGQAIRAYSAAQHAAHLAVQRTER